MAREIENVHITVLKRFETQLAGTAPIDLPGADFDSKAETNWFVPRIFGPTSAPARRGERNEAWFLDVSCFANTGETSTGAQKQNNNRTLELADAVIGDINQVDLALQDWGAAGDPAIGILRFEEAEGNPIPGAVQKSDLQQYNVRVPFQLIL